MNFPLTWPSQPAGHRPSGPRWAGLLVVSLLLNCILAAYLKFDRHGSEQPSVRPPEPVSQSPETRNSNPDPVDEPAIAAQMFTWTVVAAEDLREYAANLRWLGCPEHVVRGVMADEIRHRYVPRIRELKRQTAQRFWDDAAGAKSGHGQERTLEEIAAEKKLRAVYEEYELWQRELGRGDDQRNDRGDRFPEPDGDDVRVSFLSEDKRARLRAQDESISQLYRQLRSESVPEEEFHRRIQEHEALQDLERRQFLDPAEYAEYERRTSRHAGLFGEWHGFEPTPEERIAILEWRESIPGETPNDEDWEQGLRPLLGDTRFAELQRARDTDYRQLVELTAHLGMGETVANDVYAARQAAQAAATAVRAIDELEPGHQLEALTAIRLEAEQDLLEHLGEDGLEVYRRHADWLETLAVP
jgi:hypothetical protein